MARVKLSSEQKDLRFWIRVGLVAGATIGLILGLWIFFGGDRLTLGDDVLIHGKGFHLNTKGCDYPTDKKDLGHPLAVVKARVISDSISNDIVDSAAVKAGWYDPEGGRFVKVRVLDGPFKDHLFYVPRGFIKP